jgi:hypothetical protein
MLQRFQRMSDAVCSKISTRLLYQIPDSFRFHQATSLSTKLDHHIDITKRTIIHSMLNQRNEEEVKCK